MSSGKVLFYWFCGVNRSNDERNEREFKLLVQVLFNFQTRVTVILALSCFCEYPDHSCS